MTARAAAHAAGRDPSATLNPAGAGAGGAHVGTAGRNRERRRLRPLPPAGPGRPRCPPGALRARSRRPHGQPPYGTRVLLGYGPAPRVRQRQVPAAVPGTGQPGDLSLAHPAPRGPPALSGDTRGPTAPSRSPAHRAGRRFPAQVSPPGRDPAAQPRGPQSGPTPPITARDPGPRTPGRARTALGEAGHWGHRPLAATSQVPLPPSQH